MAVSFTRFLIDSLNTEDVSALRLLRGHGFGRCASITAGLVFTREEQRRGPRPTLKDETQTSLSPSPLQTCRSWQRMKNTWVMPTFGKLLMLTGMPPGSSWFMLNQFTVGLSLPSCRRSIPPVHLFTCAALSLFSTVSRSYKRCRLNFSVWLSCWMEHPTINLNNRLDLFCLSPPSKSMNQHLSSPPSLETIFVSTLKIQICKVFKHLCLCWSLTCYFRNHLFLLSSGTKSITTNKFKHDQHQAASTQNNQTLFKSILTLLLDCYRKSLHIQNIFRLSLVQN